MRPINLSEPLVEASWYQVVHWPLWMMPFRPYFLAGGALALVSVSYWLLLLSGLAEWRLTLPATLWHAHEMIFGFVGVVAVGFLLTAAQTWTGVPSVSGAPLMWMSLLWLGARLAFFVRFPGAESAGLVLVALFQGAWWVASVTSLANMLVSARSRHNYPFIAILSVLAVLNLVYLYLAGRGYFEQAENLINTAVLVITLMIGIVAGRVVPFFTARGLGLDEQVRLPVLDRALFWLSIAAVSYFFAAKFVVALFHPAWLLSLTAALHLIRSVRWWHRGVLAVPLLWSLHFSYLALGVGLMLMAVSLMFGVFAFKDALHLVTIGAMGMMILAMMSRVSLGHTGRTLKVPGYIALAFGLVFAAALVRSLLPVFIGPHSAWQLSAVLWVLAFLLYLRRYVPVLIQPRVDGRRG